MLSQSIQIYKCSTASIFSTFLRLTILIYTWCGNGCPRLQQRNHNTDHFVRYKLVYIALAMQSKM